MIRPDIESLYFTSNGEVSIQAGPFCEYLFLDGIRFIKIFITGIIGQFMYRLYKFNTC